MTLAFEHDRTAQFLVTADRTLDIDAAALRLELAALTVSVDASINTAWAQAALLTLVRCASRMFRGGVFIGLPTGVETVLRLEPRGALFRTAAKLGARTSAAPGRSFHLHIGPEPDSSARLVVVADGWSGSVGPGAVSVGALRAANPISGALAGAMGAAEAFRIAGLGDLRAGRRTLRLSAWGPDAPEEGRILYLPRRLWLLGLGNLGQATLSVLGLLPYADPGDLELLLQDPDRAGPENLAVQVLTEPDWLGRRKVRGAARWAEARGIQTTLVETLFGATTRPGPTDPRILLAGVDNLDARRWAAKAGFDLVLDAGLGASAADAFDLRLHAFPGARTAETAWPDIAEPMVEPELSPALEKAIAEGRLERCGAITIAGKSVGVPCTAMAAAALQVGQLCRALAGGACCDLVDASLVGPEDAVFKPMTERLAPLAFTTDVGGP